MECGVILKASAYDSARRQITAPVLWIEGAKSGLIARIARNPQDYEERKGAIEDLSIERIDDAGHNIHHDQPQRLAAAIEAFLAR